MKRKFNLNYLFSTRKNRIWALCPAIASFLAIAITDFTNGGFEAGNLSGWTVSTYLNSSGVTVASPAESTGRGDLILNSGGSNFTTVVSGSGPETQADPSLGSGATFRYPLFGDSIQQMANHT